MNLEHIVILGIVQGVTEFLPVSSSGHLFLAREIFGIPDAEGTAVDAFLHLGTLVAVLAYYRTVWLAIAKSIITRTDALQEKRRLAAHIAIATIPAAIVGYLFEEQVSDLFRTSTAVAAGFLCTGALLFASEYIGRRSAQKEQTTIWGAMFIGIAQTIALVPGVSRSGTTIAAGQSLGLSRTDAANFSFLLSGPIIAGAGVSSLGQLLAAHDIPLPYLLLGFVVSLVTGLAAITGFLKVIKTTSFVPFAAYLVILGASIFLV